MAAKSQELIQKLLQAEEQAERVVQAAREERARKLRDVKDAAEKELAPFKAKEEEKFNQEQAQAAGGAKVVGDLAARTEQEMQLVKQDYDNNKKTAIKYILDKVLDIDLSIPENIKNQLLQSA